MGMWGHPSLEVTSSGMYGQGLCCASGPSGEGTGRHRVCVVEIEAGTGSSISIRIGAKGLQGSISSRQRHEYAMPMIQSGTLVFPQCQNLSAQEGCKLHQCH